MEEDHLPSIRPYVREAYARQLDKAKGGPSEMAEQVRSGVALSETGVHMVAMRAMQECIDIAFAAGTVWGAEYAITNDDIPDVMRTCSARDLRINKILTEL